MTQNEKILTHMMRHGAITQRDAYKMGIYRLGARIWDLKHAGYGVISTPKEVMNADGSKSRIAEYTLRRKDND
jgi:hypothetical protein